MKANFSLFWGIFSMVYERTLIPNQSKGDKVQRGLDTFAEQEFERLDLFLKNGKCIECHSDLDFTQAVIRQLRSSGEIGSIGQESETLPDGTLSMRIFENGFFNIGVLRKDEDWGAGGFGFGGTPLPYTRREQAGEEVDPIVLACPGDLCRPVFPR